MIEKFMRAPYREGARGPIAFDCWGLCRVIRHDLFGLPWLPSLGSVGKDKIRENTKAYRSLRVSMEECPPEPGAIAAVLRGEALLHVGTVLHIEGRLKVIDTNPGGACLRTTGEFEASYPRVVYYRDRRVLSQQAV
ncbi:C40 family peptidase [Pseudomonas sp. Irchel 3H3]|uniref:C40 family peptidase n=1 Tax=Pseudomonas sp. Irchel 3H3 TaxID=2009038 RepID=UPI000BA3AAB0|nr:C40 family peptidase [Pseudomonas sp. Irchel 3H3]